MKKEKITVAAIQLGATPNQTENIQKALKLCKKAVHAGAEILFLPETYHFRSQGDLSALKGMKPTKESITTLQTFAKENNIWIQAGILEQIPNEKKHYNSLILISNQGKKVKTYRKTHLFEAIVEDKKISESLSFKAGKKAETYTIESLELKIGFSICFDIRFPELYQKYKKKQVDLISIPASFTKETGLAHWEVLCRARAIETQSFVIAPNQIGIGAGGKETYGNSLIIDPWGNMLKKGSNTQEEVLIETLNLAQLSEVRKKILLS